MQAFLKGGSSSGLKSKKDKPLSDAKPGSSKERRQPNAPWVEKYRPRTVDDVAFQEEVVAVLKKSLQGADLPNLLLYGPPGTGKTSTILAAARELFGADLMKQRVLELNASDERGIQVVRDKVKTFSQLSASGTRPDGRPCPPFKIVILDEADSMTNPAQASLRRTMEKETKTTRFCLICNYISRIIEPLASRCAKFRFKPLSSDILQKRLRHIAEAEKVNAEDKAITALIDTSEGDLRKAITYLQSAHRLKGEDAITEKDILEITGVIPKDMVSQLIQTCYSDSYEKLEKSVKDLKAEGYSAEQVILQIHDEVLPREDLTDKQKSVIAEKIAVCDQRLADGGDEFLQLMDLTSVMMQQFCHPGN
ncbi:replication factor C subunit 4-like [Branchiostoma floridae]|uniref:Replication factor C subunit 4 n=1 Tax=Branchiostoma floridae TaxID=7739 RepID=C3Z899_BRAFL|nr:replication factor C subunit 4-like [Branchiostoma floridae]|eukprot:XP_002595211.1 hypothetical protein BRAFLDRAFT_284971 [Branchiostoma floridae]